MRKGEIWIIVINYSTMILWTLEGFVAKITITYKDAPTIATNLQSY